MSYCLGKVAVGPGAGTTLFATFLRSLLTGTICSIAPDCNSCKSSEICYYYTLHLPPILRFMANHTPVQYYVYIHSHTDRRGSVDGGAVVFVMYVDVVLQAIALSAQKGDHSFVFCCFVMYKYLIVC